MTIKFVIQVLIFIIALPFRLIKIFFFTPKPDLEKNIYLKNNFAPIKSEEQYSTDLKILEGSIPEDIDGIFVRNGPNPKHPIVGNYHWFDGDGYLHSVELKNGKAIQYKGKYVETNRKKKEDKAGKRLFPLIGDMMEAKGFLKIFLKILIEKIKTKGKATLDKEGTANTALEFHSKRLFAMVESDSPYQVTVPGLETVGKFNYEGKLQHPFTAHPKVDPVTGEMIFFGYRMEQKPYLFHSVASKEGKIVKTVPIDTDYPAMIHDFAICDTHSIFLVFPLGLNMKEMLSGGSVFTLDQKKSAKIGIFPRHGDSKDIKWFEISNGFVFHTINAWRENNLIHLYACKSKFVSLNSDHVGDQDNSTHVHQWTVDLEKNKLVFDDQIESGKSSDFPTINNSLLGRKSQYTYLSNLKTNSKSPLFDSVSKVDLFTHKRTHTLEFGENNYGGEFYFVKKRDGKQEDDGYLMSFVHNEGTNLTSFWILDAKDLSVCAKIEIPCRIPYGFHGKWVSRSDMESQIKTI